MKGFTTDPLPFVRGTVLEWAIEEQEPQNVGLFHVTTALPAVMAHGRLMSRRQLRAAGWKGAGLGGGLHDEAPDQVSVGLLRDRAEVLLGTLRMMALAVHGHIHPAEALSVLRQASEHALWVLNGAMEWMWDEPDTKEGRAAAAFEQEEAIRARDVLSAPPGPYLYERLRAYEDLLSDTLHEWTIAGWVSDDDLLCGAPVGFTASAHHFARIRPEDLGLLQLAGKKGAGVDMVPNECELRFKPEDLVIVGVIS
jgi:hypothetical protein